MNFTNHRSPITNHQPFQPNASDPRSRPSRRSGAPNGLPPTQPLALGAQPRRRAPTHSRRRSIASNHACKHRPARARLFPPRPAPPAESESQGPLARPVPLWLLRAWLSSLLPSLVPRHSRSTQMAPVPICKCLFSYTAYSHIRLLFMDSFRSRDSALCELAMAIFPPSRKPYAQSNSGKWILIG